MAKIDEFLAKILSSRYGKDVRNAIHDSIEEINNVNEANIATVQAIAEDAEASATSASTSAGTATTKANQASVSATLAESWTVGGTGTRTGEDTNNAHYWEQQAKYWHDQAEQIAESLSGALRPMGTITFANLPSVSSATAGDMYNISDAFTTTSDFVEGAGIQVPLGSNVYMTTHQKWDVLAGSPVTGVKGNSESTYRRGNVNITKTDIGLGNVDNESLGTTDISSIGDGTVKGAISELNSEVATKLNINFISIGSVNNGETIDVSGYTEFRLRPRSGSLFLPIMPIRASSTSMVFTDTNEYKYWVEIDENYILTYHTDTGNQPCRVDVR